MEPEFVNSPGERRVIVLAVRAHAICTTDITISLLKPRRPRVVASFDRHVFLTKVVQNNNNNTDFRRPLIAKVTAHDPWDQSYARGARGST